MILRGSKLKYSVKPYTINPLFYQPLFYFRAMELFKRACLTSFTMARPVEFSMLQNMLLVSSLTREWGKPCFICHLNLLLFLMMKINVKHLLFHFFKNRMKNMQFVDTFLQWDDYALICVTRTMYMYFN